MDDRTLILVGIGLVVSAILFHIVFKRQMSKRGYESDSED